jgi:hypothetical protein
VQSDSIPKNIVLHNGMTAIVDACDFPWLSRHKWRAHWNRKANRFYVRRRVMNNGVSASVSLHRVIMNAPKGLVVDHIDGNPLNNVRSNLRLCSQSQNAKNRRVNANSRTGIRGVSYREDLRNPWRAIICVDGKRLTVGNFSTLAEAATARLKAEEKYYKNSK